MVFRTAGLSSGGGYSFVDRLRHLTIDHASLSRRGTVPPSNRDTSNISALIRLSHILHEHYLLFVSPSCFAACGHHLSPRIAIVFSLLSCLTNSSMSHSSSFLISSNTSRSSVYGGGGGAHTMHRRP